MASVSRFSIYFLNGTLHSRTVQNKIWGIQRLSPVCSYLDIFRRYKCHQAIESSHVNKQFIPGFKNSRLLHPPLTSLWKTGYRSCFHPGGSADVQQQSIAGNKLNDSPVTSTQLVKYLFRYIWPEGNWEIKYRVVLASSLLVSAKLLNVGVPFLFKYAVDHLNTHLDSPLNMTDPQSTIFATSFAILLGYCIARCGASGLNELRNAVFAKVSQHSVRQIAKNVFSHLHSLDLEFHLNRQTGALSKVGLGYVVNPATAHPAPTFRPKLAQAITSLLYTLQQI